MSKVFSDFWKNEIGKNSNIAIPIVVGIIIVIVGVIVLTNQESNVMEVEDAFNKELKPKLLQELQYLLLFQPSNLVSCNWFFSKSLKTLLIIEKSIKI